MKCQWFYLNTSSSFFHCVRSLFYLIILNVAQSFVLRMVMIHKARESASRTDGKTSALIVLVSFEAFD